MSICSPSHATLVKNLSKKVNSLQPLIPIVKKFNLNATEKFRSKRSFSPVIEKIGSNNGFEDNLNKLKDELIKFRKSKETQDKNNAKECFNVLDRITYLNYKHLFCL